ncbi:hypothetical protein Tco_0880564 [Tanacetum coccineum]
MVAIGVATGEAMGDRTNGDDGEIGKEPDDHSGDGITTDIIMPKKENLIFAEPRASQINTWDHLDKKTVPLKSKQVLQRNQKNKSQKEPGEIKSQLKSSSKRRSVVHEKTMTPISCLRTEYQLADMFTKALSEDRFQCLVRRIGMRCLTPAELEVLTNESA